MDTRIVIYVQFPEGTDLAAPDGGRFDFVKTAPFSLEETFFSFFSYILVHFRKYEGFHNQIRVGVHVRADVMLARCSKYGVGYKIMINTQYFWVG